MNIPSSKSLVKNKIVILEHIAEAWNREGINYAVAHGLEGYPEVVGRDLDVLVNPNYRERAIYIALMTFKKYQWIPMIHKKPWLVQITAFYYQNGNVYAADIGIFWQLQWGWSFLVNGLSDNYWEQGVFKVACWGGFAKRVLIQVLGGNFERINAKLDELIIYPQESYAVSDKLNRIMKPSLAMNFINAVNTKNLTWIHHSVNDIRKSILWNSLKKEFLKSITAIFTWIRIEFALNIIVQPVTPIVAIVGPDGVGKSTLIKILKEEIISHLTFTNVEVKHWRPGILPQLGNLIGKHTTDSNVNNNVAPRRQPGRFQFLRIGYYFIDFILGYFLRDRIKSSRWELILYDRCALDMAIDPIRYGLSSTRGTRLLWRLIPKPDLVVLLYDDPERIHARKPELPKEEIDQQLKKWMRLAEEGEVDAIIRVDSTPEEIAHRVKNLIIESFIEKNGGPISEESNPIKWLCEILTNGTNNPSILVGNRFRRKNKTNGSKDVYEFGWLTLKDGRGYLIPLDSRQTVIQSLNLYNAQNVKARFAKHLLSVGLRVGLAQPLLRKVGLVIQQNTDDEATDVPLLAHLKEVLGYRDLRFGISLGTPGPQRKPVLLVMSSKGEPLGYVKVGWDKQTRRLVESEYHSLKILNNQSFEYGVLPKIIYFGHYHDKCLLITEPLVLQKHLTKLEDLHIQFLCEVSKVSITKEKLLNSKFFTSLTSRLSGIEGYLPSYQFQVIEKAIDLLISRIGLIQIPWVWRLGDFTPWNISVNKNANKIVTIDLEYASDKCIPGWDIFHFISQSSHKTVDKFQDIYLPANYHVILPYFQELNIDEGLIPLLYIAYLVDLWTLWMQMWEESGRSQSVEAFRAFRRIITIIQSILIHRESVGC